MIIISEPAGKILVKTVYKKVPNSYEENKEGHFWLSFSFTLSQKLNRCHKCSTAFSRFRCSRTGGCQVSSVLVRDSFCFKWIDLFLGFQVERLLRFSSTVVAALAPKFSFNHGGCFFMETAVELEFRMRSCNRGDESQSSHRRTRCFKSRRRSRQVKTLRKTVTSSVSFCFFDS